MRKMKKAVAIQADVVVERIEDDYEQGEIGSQEYVADFVLTEPDIQSLINTLASTLEVTRDDLRDGMWADDKTAERFIFNWHRTEDEKTPNSEQTELWIPEMPSAALICSTCAKQSISKAQPLQTE